jgi:glycosyltransferase involved in cell wall biosynthesis
LVTTEQISINPRLVKEADALCEAGCDVRVVACQWQEWATRADAITLAKRPWRCHLVDYSREHSFRSYWYSRLRRQAAQRFLAPITLRFGIAERAIGRVVPELVRAAATEPADLFIGHNLGALPPAVIAARKHRARAGFDAEDFHSGMRLLGTRPCLTDSAIEDIERQYLPRCDMITAASSGIARAYAAKYGITEPVLILNVFPLSQRPREFRPTTMSGPLTLYWFSQTIGANRGLEDVVRAMGLRRPDEIQLHLRGNWQPGYRDQLFRLAASVGLKPEQIMAHDPEPPDEMVRLAAHYDVGLALEHAVSHNRDICLTNKIFTYLLAGNAVMATATQGQQSILERMGDAGFCYQPGEVNALASGLKRWCEDRLLLERARRQAWDWGTREYNWDLEKGKFLRAVEMALTASASHKHRNDCGS